MAITVGNVTTNVGNHTGGVGGTSEFSHNHNGDYLLVAVMQGFADDTANPSAVAYNGIAMTKIGEIAYSGGHGISVWEYVAPATGAHNVTLTFTNQIVEVIAAVSLSGVNQSTPHGTVVTASGSDTAPTVTVSSATGDVVIDFVASRQSSSATATVGSGQTQRVNTATSTGLPSLDVRGLSSTETGGTSVTMDWTLSASESWKGVGVPVKAASSGTLFSRSFGGSITPTGTLPVIVVSLNNPKGTITPTGSLSAQKVSSLRQQSVAGGITPNGALFTVKNPSAGGSGFPLRFLQSRNL